MFHHYVEAQEVSIIQRTVVL